MSKNLFLIIPFIMLITIIILLLTEHIYLIDNVYNYIVIHNKFLTNVFKAITFLGSFWGISIIFIANIFLTKNKQDTKELFLILIISLIINNILKLIFMRPRPDLIHLVIEKTYSFPSGHASTAMTFYGFIIYKLRFQNLSPNLKMLITICLSTLIILIGYSRIYLNVHYVSDVCAGFLTSMILLYLFINFKNKRFTLIRKTKI